MKDCIYVAVPVKDRKAITLECLPTLRDGMDLRTDSLVVYDDGSNPTFWRELDALHDGANGRGDGKSIGIEAQRRLHFREFWSMKNDFNFMYLTDSDALHDPTWREVALDLHRRTSGAPICLYNTLAHSTIPSNTTLDVPEDPVVWRRVAPGISYLLSRAHVEQVMRHIDRLDNWDWMVPMILGHRMAITRTSYVDHIGLGGLHHPKDAGLDGGDVALNPTPWLVQKRAEVIDRLRAIYGSEAQVSDQRPSPTPQSAVDI